MEYNFTIEKMSQNKTKTLNQLSPTAAINKSYIYIQCIFIPIFNIKRQYIKMRQMQVNK